MTEPSTDIEFIRSPLDWPRWPVLPVTKRERGETNNVGLIWGSVNPKPEVIVGVNMWGLNDLPGETWDEKLKPFERVKYASFEELLKVWRID